MRDMGMGAKQPRQGMRLHLMFVRNTSSFLGSVAFLFSILLRKTTSRNRKQRATHPWINAQQRSNKGVWARRSVNCFDTTPSTPYLAACKAAAGSRYPSRRSLRASVGYAAVATTHSGNYCDGVAVQHAAGSHMNQLFCLCMCNASPLESWNCRSAEMSAFFFRS